VRTLINEWAYAQSFVDTAERVTQLGDYLDFHNRRRPHRSLAAQSPMSRIHVNNLTGTNT
jgi:hypothetical protein